MTFEIVNGALAPEHTEEARHAVAERVHFTVEPFGQTSLKARNGIKMAMGKQAVSGKVVLFEGMIGDVRTYVTEKDGKVHVIMTRNEMLP